MCGIAGIWNYDGSVPAEVRVRAMLEAQRHRGPDGRGLQGTFPPLAQSDFLAGDVDAAIRVLIEGRQGPITVNGKTYDGAMPNFSLVDEDIAAVLSYVRSNFGNRGKSVAPADVRRVRGVLAQASPPEDQAPQ